MRSGVITAAVFAGVLALYVGTLAQVHDGDTVAFMLQAREGLWLDPGHLLMRPQLILLLAGGDVLIPGLSSWQLMAGSEALSGALAAALVALLLLRRGVRAPLAVLTAAALAVTRAAWLLSTTFEGHGSPVVLLLAVALVLDGTHPASPRRAAAAGLLLGLAASFHLIAAPLGLVWLAQLAADGRPWRERLGLLVAFSGAAALTLHAVHLSLFLVASQWAGLSLPGPPVHWLFSVAAVSQAVFLAPTDAFLPLPLARIPGAQLSGLVQALAAIPPGAGVLRLWGLGVGLGASVLIWRLPALWRRHGSFALVPVVWIAASLPLAAAVDTSNYEYYRITWVGAGLAAALVLDEGLRRLPAGWGRAAAPGSWIGGAALVAVLVWANAASIAQPLRSPYGEPAGVVRGQPTVIYSGTGESRTHGRRHTPPRPPPGAHP